MPRYFIDLAYKGTRYSGFQTQQNAVTIQSVLEKALETIYKTTFQLTCSSRTDAGVHALQNYFHLDTDVPILPKQVYNINSLLPSDIVVKKVFLVNDDAHARFSATNRRYKYYITRERNPFLNETAWYYPYNLDVGALQQAAAILTTYTDFTSFSKRNTQVKTFLCNIETARWYYENDCLVFEVKANRFLRGMVRGLVGTMLQVGRGLICLDNFKQIIEAKDCTKANFNTPAHGLFLVEVTYPNLSL
jgi:tRNA pseudouridine38-40 synthase